MLWRIEINNKQNVADPVEEGLKKDIIDLGIGAVQRIDAIQVFIIEAQISKEQVSKICEELLCDSIISEYTVGMLQDKIFYPKLKKDFHIVEVAYNPGVMDPWEESTKKGIKDLGISGVAGIKTGRRYLISGKITKEQMAFIAEKLLYNKVIQHTVEIEQLEKSFESYKSIPAEWGKNIINLISLSDRELLILSKDRHLYLNMEEMTAVKKYFSSLGRSPSDCELETIAQTWSEHCGHKTMRGIIEYTDNSSKEKGGKNKQIIQNLLKSTIMEATKQLNKSWCVSVFQDNAGIVKFDNDFNICFKVETHNHPSALEPYGGAGTGIGGVIRDILGAGLGAKPIMNTDVFCFGPPNLSYAKLPKGLLHPKRIMKGVVAGVADYGNRMGIPTANGAILFDQSYVANPLVYCGTLGIMPQKYSFKKVTPGEYVVLIGGKTGRDGIHGATFSSTELTHASEQISSGAVQIGNPITEKKMLDTLLQARDKNLYTALTDCGGGGLSSAVGEIGQETGVKIDLEKIPLKYKGLTYSEIWISEAQERMILAVPKKNLKQLLNIFKKEDVEASVIGQFSNTKRLELFFYGKCVCDLDMKFLHEGIPATIRKAVWNTPRIKNSKTKKTKNLTKALLKVLSDLNICSKEWVIRQYDHEVQGMSVLKPLAGVCNDGPQNAAVIKPLPYSKKGMIVSCGINSRYSRIDPYWMAVSCIDEALRQIIAVGGNLDRIALLDNFSWGNTSKPECLGQLVRACYGCYDASLGYGVPFISGKDSLNNEYISGKKSISIAPTLLISAVSVIEDIEKIVSSDAKSAGNLIYCVGTSYDELGGSCYYCLNGWSSPNVPKVNFTANRLIFERLSKCINNGMVKSCHDCSEGGLGAALAEMSFSGNLGMEIFLSKISHKIAKKRYTDDTILFSESNGRFIVEVEEDKKNIFETTLNGINFALVGKLIQEKEMKVFGVNDSLIIHTGIDILKKYWQNPLCW